MKKHRHIPMGNGHITWHGKTDPTQEQLNAFQEMHDAALNLDIVMVSVCSAKFKCDMWYNNKCIAATYCEHLKQTEL